MKPYFVALYDSFDGWTSPIKYFNTIEEARYYKDEQNKTLDEANKRMGEHFGIFKETGKATWEIECTYGCL